MWFRLGLESWNRMGTAWPPSMKEAAMQNSNAAVARDVISY